MQFTHVEEALSCDKERTAHKRDKPGSGIIILKDNLVQIDLIRADITFRNVILTYI